MTILAKFKGDHGVALSTYGGDVESAVTDRGPHAKATPATPAAPAGPLSTMSFEAAEARRLELEEERTRRGAAVPAAQRALEAAENAYQDELVEGRRPDFLRVTAAQADLRRAQIELEAFDRAATAHRPLWLRAKIDALEAQAGLHRAAAAEHQRQADAFTAARLEAERHENDCVNAVFAASQRASTCATEANALRRELKLP